MSAAKAGAAPDNTAVRVAQWRALHLEVDAPPHVLDDTIGLTITAPEEGWRDRPDMNARFTALFHASIVARARSIEALVAEQTGKGVGQYVLLGVGLDTLAQRRPELAARLTIFEIDPPGPQEWKRQRLVALGYGVLDFLRLVPVAVIASTGVSMYLSTEANAATLRRIAGFAPGSTLALTYILPLELAAPELRPGLEASAKGARAAGTPFLSFYALDEMLALARSSGFNDATIIGAAELNSRYFAGRSDGLGLADGEQLLVART